ncbi:hypothetical protein FHR32_005246 [Streptosporangium album]|uniref:Uncharacterized protein n=1 Tax=Streptosporangium album TaxID=47479 RepID=A0A7W7RZ05_9ACTN|nr:hypothetical protein [Streptosporangium album]
MFDIFLETEEGFTSSRPTPATGPGRAEAR